MISQFQNPWVFQAITLCSHHVAVRAFDWRVKGILSESRQLDLAGVVSVSGPAIWNSLLYEVCQSMNNAELFKKRMRTFSFIYRSNIRTSVDP